MIQVQEALTFDDVLLKPKYSEIDSRSKVDLSVSLPKGIKLSHPVIPANMATITGCDMAEAILFSGGMAIVHRFIPLKEQLGIAQYLQDAWSGKSPMKHIGFSIGVKKEDYEAVKQFAKVGVRILCIDIAHGDSKACISMCQYISKEYPGILLIAGNVATGEGAKRLWKAGADIVKVGIGNGSLCTTRIETGNGVPQLSALMEVSKIKKELTEGIETTDYSRKGYTQISIPIITRPIGIISDGGATNYGDLAKALCFADLVMSGNMFSGAPETPGEILEMDGQRYKSYVGSSTHKTNHIEGVKAIVPIKPSVKEILQKIRDAISSGCSYQGVSNLADLRKDPEFVKITHAGLIESHPHNVKVIG